MPTIAEILSAKQKAAAKSGTTKTEDPELTEAVDRIDPPGKRKASASLVLSKTDSPEPQPQEVPLATWQEGRALGATSGELIPMAPASAWPAAMAQLEAQLCVMQDPTDAEACWLALRSSDSTQPPLLLHRLPWLLYPAPPSNDAPF